ncbi:right-handed parallel beta-helix repeat-containing protein [Ornithinimicrobium avium]|uniref:right-handed parallel beta-helix repeat-containing protein n=1 Tax=Ornithinimicrobium avium TaxID=2283195 RepID=UPI0013B422BD|nr:right-handed parallel beta-helix repeat-containing protein [Ornithinimicrobium avium]
MADGGPPAADAATLLDCAPVPSTCGYPDATSTGVTDEDALRVVGEDTSQGDGWELDPRGWVRVSTDGAVVEDLDVPYNLDITADHVTLRNVRVRVGGETFGISLRHTSDVTIEDVTITAPDQGAGRLMVGVKDIYGDSTGTVVRRADISHVSTGVQLDAGLVEDSYIHDLGMLGEDHVNGITSNGGGEQLTIRHNTVLNEHPQTDAISLFQDFGTQRNRLITDNLVAGGGYTLYAGAGALGPTEGIRVTDNRFSRLYFPASGRYGPLTAYEPGPGNVLSGNVWDDTGRSISGP